jgi:serine/threonine protein kinase
LLQLELLGECKVDIHLLDGALILDGKQLPFNSYEMKRVIGSGANGVVLLARHKYLDGERAIKLWLRLRGADRRDKFRQGIEEARKAADAHNREINTVRVYEAGQIEEYFYSVMDYFEGDQLKNWLGQRPTLWARMEFAASLFSAQLAMHRAGIVHGDLHHGNVLIRAPADDLGWPPTEFRIVDFGTSTFALKQNSIDRDRKVFRSTMAKLLEPFPVDRWLDHFSSTKKDGHLAGSSTDEYPLRYDLVIMQIDFIMRLMEADIWGTSHHDIATLKKDITERFLAGDFSENIGENIGDIKRAFHKSFSPELLGCNWKWLRKNRLPHGYLDAVFRHSKGVLEPYNWF